VVIRVEAVHIRAGEFRVKGATLEIGANQYGVVMGNTGSGKTTLLEAIAGLKPIESGKITLAGKDVTCLQPAERNVGYVPQDGALFPSMTVEQHLAFPLHIRGQSANRIKERVGDLAALLNIEPLLRRRTKGLSGGERQRVALGRAISFHPKTLLLDEPLSALDDAMREQMCELLKLVQREASVTIMHVTHSTKEADTLADCRFRFHLGELTAEQVQPQGEPAPDRRDAPSPK
jgi:ABC-type sugar transport system ATPase subunit